MKTVVKVAFSVQFINTVTVTVTSENGHKATVSEKCSTANIKATVIKAKVGAIERLATIEAALDDPDAELRLVEKAMST